MVEARDEGRRRMYRLNARALKPHPRLGAGLRALPVERFDGMDAVLEDLKRGGRGWG